MAAENVEPEERWGEFYRRYYKNEIGKVAQGEKTSLAVDYADVETYDPDLADDLVLHPDETRRAAEDALADFDIAADVSLESARVRFSGFRPTTGIRSIRSDDVNKLIAVEGIVRKATEVRPKVLDAAFECQRCGTLTTVEQTGQEFSEPHQCRGCERQGPFRLLEDQSDFVDAQKLRVQESPEGLRGGQTPQKIDVNIEGDITGKVSPGDRVTATGVLRAIPDDGSTTFEVFIEGNNVEIEDQDFEDFEITEEDVETIREIASSPNLYENIRDSFAPSIYGYETEKLAMILQLFAGVKKSLPDGTRIRGDMHILLIGDPGTGKSQLLQYAQKIAPRGIYTSGKGATSAGLTAAAVQDDFGDGKWTLEAGALVLADKGIACVDEVDKMDQNDRSALHEALEQQQVSIAKAGINATLKSRCSLLGAANPKYGRFDKYEGIAEQIDLEPALISRFDLIFTVTDDVDEEEDANIAGHILQTNYAGEVDASGEDAGDEMEEIDPDIEPETLRKYVAYARRECNPTMTGEARERIQEFYVDLRAQGGDGDAVPVTARKLEALVRLAEASARVRISDKVEMRDAERAIEVTTASLDQVGRDPETGEFDIDVIESGTSQTQRDRIKGIKEIISVVCDDSDDGKASLEEIIELAEEHDMSPEKTREEIDDLRRRGELIEPEKDHFRLV
ncbi:MAG: minichromosome maintenance protein MCM [Halobacteriales archaeon]